MQLELKTWTFAWQLNSDEEVINRISIDFNAQDWSYRVYVGDWMNWFNTKAGAIKYAKHMFKTLNTEGSGWEVV